MTKQTFLNSLSAAIESESGSIAKLLSPYFFDYENEENDSPEEKSYFQTLSELDSAWREEV